MLLISFIVEDDPDRIGGALITYFVSFDPKGWIPTFVVNHVLGRQPLVIGKIAEHAIRLNVQAGSS